MSVYKEFRFERLKPSIVFVTEPFLNVDKAFFSRPFIPVFIFVKIRKQG